MGLMHYPVYNKNREIIASAITTFDLHDLSRVARTYGVKGLYVVTPLEDQQRLAERVLEHWKVGYGARYNPNRKEALDGVRVTATLEEAVAEISEREGERPLLMATDARTQKGRCLSYPRAREIITGSRPALILFGTAWGLKQEVIEEADYLLEPIQGGTDYNHLSVRAAAAIIVDRLAGGDQER
jgi:hypothetical protein